jgi:hypothetical protein
MSRKNKATVQKSLSQLSSLVESAGMHLKPEDSLPAIPRKRSEDPKQPAQNPDSGINDDEIFREAMNDVARASWRHNPHPASQPIPVPTGDPDSENLRLMQSAIVENGPVPVLDHPEYIEGCGFFQNFETAFIQFRGSSTFMDTTGLRLKSLLKITSPGCRVSNPVV